MTWRRFWWTWNAALVGLNLWWAARGVATGKSRTFVVTHLACAALTALTAYALRDRRRA